MTRRNMARSKTKKKVIILRLGKNLHRDVIEAAEENGVSANHFMIQILQKGHDLRHWQVNPHKFVSDIPCDWRERWCDKCHVMEADHA